MVFIALAPLALWATSVPALAAARRSATTRPSPEEVDTSSRSEAHLRRPGVILHAGAGLPVATPPSGLPSRAAKPRVGPALGAPATPVGRWESGGSSTASSDAPVSESSVGRFATTFGQPDTTTGTAAGASGPPGVWALGAAGNITNLAGAPWFGSPASQATGASGVAVSISSDESGNGYWVLGAAGSVWNEGDVGWYGSPIHTSGGTYVGTTETAIAAVPNGSGYWVLGANGAVDNYGSAGWWGSPHWLAGGGNIGTSDVGIAATPTGDGYWVLGANGSVDNFGRAGWWGSPKATAHGGAIGTADVGIAADGLGGGYWVLGANGAVDNYGSAGWWGSPHWLAHGGALPAPAVAITATPAGNGYWVLLANGTIEAFGAANPVPSLPSTPLPSALAASSLGSLLPPGKTGYDVSFPQCSSSGASTAGPLPSSGKEFAVVGANWGGTFSMNTCVAAEAAWAGQPMDYYFNLDQPWWYDPTAGDTGPAGTCSDPGSTSSTCVAYNYGWNATQWTLAQLASDHLSVPGIWLDIEIVGSCGTSGYWSCDTAVNANVIAGAIAAAHAEGVAIGIYSTAYQWGVIAGSYDPSVPEWIPGAGTLADAQGFCPAAASKNFASGPIAAIQYGYIDGGPNPFDPDWSCPAPLG